VTITADWLAGLVPITADLSRRPWPAIVTLRD